MTAGALERPPPAATLAGDPAPAGPALTRLAVRQVWRGAAVVLVVVAGMSATVAAQYATVAAGALDGPAMEALAANPAVRVLFGPAVALDDPGGFTVWRTATPVAMLVGVWALLAATRTTRGEEEAGRWDLLLAGRVRRADLVARHLGVLAVAVVLVGAVLTAALIAAGTAAAGALLHGAGIAGAGVGSAALGVLAAQVLPTRTGATEASVAVLGAGLLLRMVADGVGTLAWARWLTPFGLLAEVQPYAANRPGPLLPLWGAALLLGAAGVALAGRRDAGGGLLDAPGGRAPRLHLLGSLDAFALRRGLRTLRGWALGIGAYFLLIGVLAGSVTDFLAGNPRFAELAAAAGVGGLDQVPGLAAALFGLLAIPVGVYAAAQLAAGSADEASGRSVALFSLPVSRVRLALAEAGATGVGVVVLLLVAALAVGAGTAAAGVPLGPWQAVAGVLNVAPIPLLCVGAGVLALGWLPRAVFVVGSLPAVGGFLLRVVAENAGAPDWVVRLSPFAHLAAVPQVAADWQATAVMCAVALALTTIGLIGYTRRDLRT